MKTLIALAAAGLMVAVPASAQTSDETGIRAVDVLLRLRTIVVTPNEKSTGITPAFPTEKVSLGNAVMPEIDATYMVTDNIGLELIASTTKHSFGGTSGTTGTIGKLGSTWVLPPTLTAQYHFNSRGKIRPYVGAGVNYTIFWDEKASDGLEGAVGATKVRMSESFGWAAQAGIDVDLTKKVFLNLDVKYIDINTDARLDTTAIGTLRSHVKVNPLVFGVGLGVRL